MAVRPWVRPEEVKEYSEHTEVQQRSDSRLEVDIARAEQRVINYCNRRFDGEGEEIPQPVRLAVILLAEAYAHNAVLETRTRLKSETYDDYSYTAESSIIDIDKVDIASLLDEYTVVEPKNGVTLRLRRL